MHLGFESNIVRFGRFAKGIVMPAVGVGRDAHGETERGHGGALGQRDECTASFMRSAHEAHTVGAGEFGAGEHDDAESAGAEQEISGGDGLFVAARTDEERPIIPERTGDGERAVYPGGAIAVSDGGETGSAKNRRAAAVRFAEGELAERESAAGERAIELGDAGCRRPDRSPREGDRVGELLLNEGPKSAEFGELGGHL